VHEVGGQQAEGLLGDVDVVPEGVAVADLHSPGRERDAQAFGGLRELG
jgi:hypothetical protein